jgi:hypothetical protein
MKGTCQNVIKQNTVFGISMIAGWSKKTFVGFVGQEL